MRGGRGRKEGWKRKEDDRIGRQRRVACVRLVGLVNLSGMVMDKKRQSQVQSLLTPALLVIVHTFNTIGATAHCIAYHQAEARTERGNERGKSAFRFYVNY